MKGLENTAKGPQRAEEAARSYEVGACFLAANGYSGFRSHYGDVFTHHGFDRILVIKGGPGTGKSRTMRHVARAAEAAGAQCRYIYCSSDPDSLDAIVLTKNGRRVALLDGTTPHVRDAELPGAVDELLNLGQLWDTYALTAARKDILALSEKKAGAYRRAYRYLALAGGVDSYRRTLLSDATDTEKLRRAAGRELRLMRISSTPREEVAYLSAFGMTGAVRLPVPGDSPRVVSVSDDLGAGYLYLNVLRDILREEGLYRYALFPSCFDEDLTEALYLPDSNIVFVKSRASEAERTVNIKRFLLAPEVAKCRRELRLLSAAYDRFVGEARAALSAVKEHHFALEGIYGAAMDFGALDAYVDALIPRVLSMLAGE